MSIEKMTLVQITGEISCVDQVLMQASQCGYFHPEQLPNQSGGFQQMSEQNPYRPTAPLRRDGNT